jgi:hypothetical protein
MGSRMSSHNIVGSEAFESHQLIHVRRYPRRGGTWRNYAIAAFIGGGATFGAAGLLIFLAQTFGGH